MDAFRQLEQQAHDRAVDTYTEFFAPVTSGSLDDLLTAAGVRRGARVLDVATGPGSGAARAAALGAVADATWTVPVPTLDVWWSGGLVSMVRIAALVRAQAPDVQRRVRVIFDRLAERDRVGESYVLPMAARVGSGRKP